MIVLQHFPGYKIYICKNIISIEDIHLNKYDVVVHLNKGFIRGIIHIKSATYHYLETLRYKNKWIRDPNYRFLAFLLMEDQVNKIKEKVESRLKDITVIITKNGIHCEEVVLDEGDDYILSQLTTFRLKLEKERLLK